LKKTLYTIIKVLFFLGLGFFFIWIFVHKLTQEQIDQIFNYIQNANYWWLALSFFLGILSHYARAARSVLMLETMGYHPKVSNSFYAVMVGYLANLAVPRLGEVLRCTFLKQYENIPFQKSFGTIITERAIDMLIFVILFFIAFAVEFERINDYVNQKVFTPFIEKFGSMAGNFAIYGFLAFILAIVISWWFLRKWFQKFTIYQKIVQLLLGLWEGIISIAKLKRPYLFLFHTALIWLSYYFMTYVCFFAFDGLANLSPSVAFVCLVFGTVAFMLVQGGIGLYPVIIAGVLGLFGVSNLLGYAAGWVGWSVQEGMILILGLLSLLMASLNKKKHDAN
jgi:uncharacterized protein (TIRG00374 family)